ncbi:MAG: glycosyltransferase family 39 protein [Candidatus Chisholmbacteria bacterium]|nr:glycosyltransferase family 39 protein [Candidatus Chisholmbacteria bacterium]
MKSKPIALILIVALLLRLISLNQSLWLDEAIQWWAVTTFPLKHLITEYILGDFNPPLFHIILWFWVKLAGTSEISLRLPSVLFGTLAVWFVYKIGQFVFPKKNLAFGIWHLAFPEAAVLLVATGPLLVYYSQEARMYSLTAFTATGTFYSLLSYRKNPSRLFAICYLLFATAMLYSHYLTWLLVPLLLILNPTLTLVSLAALIPWLPIFWQQLSQGIATVTINPIWADVVGELSLKNASLIPIKFLLGRISIDNNYAYAGVLMIPLGIAAYLLYKALPRKSEKNLKILWSWLILPIILAALLALKIPVFSYFRFLFLVPVFYLLMARGLSTLRPKVAITVFIVALLFNLSATSVYLFNPKFHRENWQGASNYIETQTPQNFPVVIYSAVAPPYAYYNREAREVLSEKELSETVNYESVWYIPYAQPIFDPENSIYQTLLDLGFTEVDRRHFNGVTVIRLRNLNYRFLSSNDFSFFPSTQLP